MARMTRTQVTLEESEYRFLKARAAETGSSLSSVVRGMVRDRMRQVAAGAPHVWDVAGMISESAFSGRDHDAVIYGGDPGTSDADGGGTRPAGDGA
jgi:hypothetical protein